MSATSVPPKAEESLPFKKNSMVNNQPGAKKRVWKSLKQILATERTLQWPQNAITCKFSDRFFHFKFIFKKKKMQQICIPTRLVN